MVGYVRKNLHQKELCYWLRSWLFPKSDQIWNITSLFWSDLRQLFAPWKVNMMAIASHPMTKLLLSFNFVENCRTIKIFSSFKFWIFLCGTKLVFEYYRIAGRELANKVWMPDLKSVANIPMPRLFGKTVSGNIDIQQICDFCAKYWIGKIGFQNAGLQWMVHIPDCAAKYWIRKC